MLKEKTILVVGGNAAGPAAAAKAKRINPEAKVILIEAGEHISTGTCELPYILSEEIDDYNKIVFYTAESFEAEKNVKVYTQHLVEHVDRKAKSISITNLKNKNSFNLQYDSLILTTGSKANKINNLDSNLSNVFYLKTVSNLIKIEEFKKSNKIENVLIIGAGYIGLEVAESFVKIGSKVRIIEKSSLPMAGASKEIQHLIKDNLQKKGVEFYGGESEPKIFTKENRVHQIKIDGRYLDIDLVIVAIGFSPNNDLAKKINLEIGKFGGIKVDQKMQTSDYNIYAAGDNVEVTNFVNNQKSYLPVATFAQAQGHVAGENAAGGNTFFKPVVKNIAVKIFENVYVSVGLNEEEIHSSKFTYVKYNSVANNLVKVMPNSKKTFAQIYIEKHSGLILGAEFFGGAEVIGHGNIISMMIKNRIKGEKLSETEYNYTPPLSPFINILSILGRKIKKGA